ncbi:MAG: hypothetical protein AB8G26_13020 [Ilumatobacter sp.]
MILAHHELFLLAQGSASIGLAGWAAAIGARWYSIRHRRAAATTGATDAADHHEGDARR